MSAIHVKTSLDIPAPPERIYNVLSDYEQGHQDILPRQYFQRLNILEGGQGAGTVFTLKMTVWGQSFDYHMRVTEPETGRRLRETDINTGQYSEFIIEPISENHTRVTIESAFPTSNGIKGMVERIMQPIITRKIFNEELQILSDYVTT